MNDDNDNRRAYHDDVDDADYGRVIVSYTCLQMAQLRSGQLLFGIFLQFSIVISFSHCM